MFVSFLKESQPSTVGRRFVNPFPKMPGVGSLHLEWRECGKPTCRCARGHLHGPYPVLRWREDGRQRKALVRPQDVLAVLAAIVERRALPPVSRIRASLRGAERPRRPH
jgi:hypothetical protein